MEDRSSDQHDAYAVARWLQEAGWNGALLRAFSPPEPEPVAMNARVEGWIFGVEWPPKRKKPKARKKATHRNRKTTDPGYVNRNKQEVIARTDLQGSDFQNL